MVPHSNDTINGGQQPVSHKRAKSGRVAPAIPYALVKPKTKAKQAALEPIIDTKKPDAVLLPSDNSSTIKHEQAAAIPDHGPETPASVESIQDKADVPELDTPVESVSDHIHDSSAKVDSSVTTSPPPSHAATSPMKDVSGVHEKIGLADGLPQVADDGNSATSDTNSDERMQADASSLSNGQPTAHQHHSNHSVDEYSVTSYGSQATFTAQIVPPLSSSSLQMFPSGAAPPAYSGFASPQALTSPTSAWNPNANFIPPGHHNQRVAYDNMSERAISNTSSNNDARYSHQPLMSQPLPPVDNLQWSRYLSNFYSASTFADFSLNITTPTANKYPEFPVHGLILARSPTLSGIIRAAGPNPQRNEAGAKCITLNIDERLTSYSAVLEAIGYLYGLPLPNFGDGVIPNAPFSVLVDRMKSALALAGAGQRLALPEIMAHSLAFATGFISWATFEMALSFANAAMANLPAFDHQDARLQDLPGIFVHHISSLMFSLEHFVIANFPTGFQFVDSAPELHTARRLPTIVESRASMHNPRLASIQFGEMPTQGPESLDSGVLLSSILLSVPSQFIMRILDSTELASKLGTAALVSLVKEVVKEREVRRVKVAMVGRKMVPSATHSQRDELLWAESLVEYPGAPNGFRLLKTADHPSSGTFS